MAIFIKSLPRIGRLWPFSSNPRQGLDSCGHFHRILAKDWAILAIFIESSPRIGRYWPYSSNPRQGLGDIGHIHRILVKDWAILAIFIKSLPRIGRYWPYSSNPCQGLDASIRFLTHSFRVKDGRKDVSSNTYPVCQSFVPCGAVRWAYSIRPYTKTRKFDEDRSVG